MLSLPLLSHFHIHAMRRFAFYLNLFPQFLVLGGGTPYSLFYFFYILLNSGENEVLGINPWFEVTYFLLKIILNVLVIVLKDALKKPSVFSWVSCFFRALMSSLKKISSCDIRFSLITPLEYKCFFTHLVISSICLTVRTVMLCPAIFAISFSFSVKLMESITCLGTESDLGTQNSSKHFCHQHLEMYLSV